MLNFKCVLTLPLEQSYVPRRKFDPLSAASLITAVAPSVVSTLGNIGSSVFGYNAQRDENQVNRDWQERMWHMNNAYNTPLAQRQRLEEAGYNPYLLTQDASASGQSVMPSSPASSPLPGFGQPFSGISQALQQGLQVQSNIELQHTEAMEKLYGILFKAYEEGGQELFDKTSRELAPTLERFDWQNSPLARKLEVYMRGAELKNFNLELDNSFKELENKWFDILSSDSHNLNADTHKLNEDLHRQYVEVLNRIRAEIKEINSRTDLNVQQKENLVTQNAGQIISNGLTGLDFQNKKALQSDIQEITRETLSNLREDTGLKSSQNTYFFESGKTQKHNRKHSKTQAGPFLFEYQGYGE